MSVDPAQVHTDLLVGLSQRASAASKDVICESPPVAGLRLLIDVGRLSPTEAEDLVLLGRTFWQPSTTGRLTSRETVRLNRVVRIIAAAEATFGSIETAALWLRRPTSSLENHAPLALLETDEGAETVDKLLSRIDHGLAV